jgi:hypothetical protein
MPLRPLGLGVGLGLGLGMGLGVGADLGEAPSAPACIEEHGRDRTGCSGVGEENGRRCTCTRVQQR